MSVSNSYVEVGGFLEGFSNTVWVGVSGFWGLLSYNMEWIFFLEMGGGGCQDPSPLLSCLPDSSLSLPLNPEPEELAAL